MTIPTDGNHGLDQKDGKLLLHIYVVCAARAKSTAGNERFKALLVEREDEHTSVHIRHLTGSSCRRATCWSV